MDIHIKEKLYFHVKKMQNHAENGTYNKSNTQWKEAEKRHSLLKIRNKGGKQKDNKKLLLKAAGEKGIREVSDQMEGGEELEQASLLAYEVLQPVRVAASRNGERIKRSILEQRQQKYKVVTPQKGNIKAVSKPISNRKADETDRRTVEQDNTRETVRKRKMKSFISIKEEEIRSIKRLEKKGKVLFRYKRKLAAGKMLLHVLGVFGIVLGIVAVTAIPLAVLILVLYHSPFALFLPPLQQGETVASVTETYLSEFVAEVERTAQEHVDCEEGEIYYRDLKGNMTTSMPQKDIMCVYMVKFGIGEMSSVMNTASKNMLKGVFTDMCTYTTSVRTEERKDEKGRTYKVDILEVNVVLKYYWDMVTEYTFNQGQIEMLEQMIYY